MWKFSKRWAFWHQIKEINKYIEHSWNSFVAAKVAMYNEDKMSCNIFVLGNWTTRVVYMMKISIVNDQKVVE